MNQVLILAIILSLSPALIRTYNWSNNAHGLVILATWKDNDFPMNPYDRDGYLITPGIAKWLLLNFDYPYGRCSPQLLGCEQPLINYVGAGLDHGGSKSIEAGYEILNHLIDRGEDIDGRFEGFTPLHEAILFCNSRYIKTLIRAGSNIQARIEKAESKVDGMNAIEFADFIDNSNNDFSNKNCETLKALRSANET